MYFSVEESHTISTNKKCIEWEMHSTTKNVKFKLYKRHKSFKTIKKNTENVNIIH